MHEPANSKRPDYVAEYLGEWANPRNELHEVRRCDQSRLRERLSRWRAYIYADDTAQKKM